MLSLNHKNSTMKAKQAVLILSFLLFGFHNFAQSNPGNFVSSKNEVINSGMFVLGGWAIGNMATGTYGWVKGSGSEKYFHQMNVLWNSVNFTLAAIGLLQNKNEQQELTSFIERSKGFEKTLMINAGLDIVYMGSGLLLKHWAKNDKSNRDMFEGYGNSLILQGGFLFIFDLTLARILNIQTKRFGSNLNISSSSAGTGISIRYRF